MTSCTIDLICLHGMGEIDMSITTKAKCFDCLPGKIVDNFIVVNRVALLRLFTSFFYRFSVGSISNGRANKLKLEKIVQIKKRCVFLFITQFKVEIQILLIDSECRMLSIGELLLICRISSISPNSSLNSPFMLSIYWYFCTRSARLANCIFISLIVCRYWYRAGLFNRIAANAAQ